VVHLDDILVHSSGTLEQHWALVRKVLGRLREGRLFAKAAKSEFGRTHVRFLGHVLSKGGAVDMEREKVRSVFN
jgi:hypothetical protein